MAAEATAGGTRGFSSAKASCGIQSAATCSTSPTAYRTTRTVAWIRLRADTNLVHAAPYGRGSLRKLQVFIRRHDCSPRDCHALQAIWEPRQDRLCSDHRVCTANSAFARYLKVPIVRMVCDA